jgi:hypothetical protein
VTSTRQPNRVCLFQSSKQGVIFARRFEYHGLLHAISCHAMQPLGPKTRYSDNATLTRREFLRPLACCDIRAIRFALRRRHIDRTVCRDPLRYVTLLISDSVSIVEYLSPSCHRQLDIGALPRPALPALLIDRVIERPHWQERRIFSSQLASLSYRTCSQNRFGVRIPHHHPHRSL